MRLYTGNRRDANEHRAFFLPIGEFLLIFRGFLNKQCTPGHPRSFRSLSVFGKMIPDVRY